LGESVRSRPAHSISRPTPKTELDLRQPAHAKRLEKVLGELDVKAAFGAGDGSVAEGG
jgi:hypothetical protein